ncbi:MAG: sugar phosphate isomerase/epimerase [Defluviitaleaceae bacterium]|nr:sugar phosphate isomerase/epimerase [Defluviitaleaceae bacterium]
MKYSVFTKPWREISIDELSKKVAGWGFDGIEFPLRPGYQVEPENAEKDLPAMAAKMKDYGLSIMSVASGTDENIFAACQAADVPIIRVMAGFDLKKGYLNCEKEFRTYLDGLQPLCEKYKVKVGVQNHNGPMVFNSMELKSLLEGFDPALIGAVWDAAHSGLAGEIAAQGLDIIWDKLLLVNLKNAYWKEQNGPEAEEVTWQPYYTLGRYGMASYPEIIDYLKTRGYKGDICLPAEYTDEPQVERLTPVELAYVKSLYDN